MHEPSESLAPILARAARFIAAMARYEAELAAPVEAVIFPVGVPVPLTITALMRALTQQLTLSAEAMARADIEHSKFEAARRPDPRRTSLISQPVAIRLAQSATLEDIVNQRAEEVGAKVEARIFPDGHAPWTSLLMLLGDLRGAMEDQIIKATSAETMSAEAIGDLSQLLGGISKMVLGMCSFAPDRALVQPLEAVLEEIADAGG